MIPAMGVSASLHIFMIVGFALVLLVGPGKGNDNNGDSSAAIVGDVDEARNNDQNSDDNQPDLTNPFIGNNPDIPFPTNDSTRLAEQTVDGKTNPDQDVGIVGGEMEKVIITPPAGMPNLLGPSNGGLGNMIGDLGQGQLVGLDVGGGFMGRSAATRARLAEKGGGNGASEAAVGKALIWFSKHQSRDGHWAMDDFQNHVEFENGKEVQKTCNCEGGALHDNIAGTAFALLPFLGAGLTPDTGKTEEFDYTKQILKGLEYLRTKQLPDGRFAEGGQQDNEQYSMYNHALATICMSEAASLYPKDWVRNSAQAALNFLAHIQEPQNGGWRYGPKPQPGDTSVVGWCVMALQSGRLAGLKVNATVFDKAKHFLDSVEAQDSGGLFYGYTDKNNAPNNKTLTAVGTLCRMYLGWQRDNPKLVKAWHWLKTNGMPDPNGNTDLYFWYYATQIMHHMGGDPDDNAPATKEFRDGWKEWNKRLRDMLVQRQDQGKNGHAHQQGSWTPGSDQWCAIGGRVMMTSLATLTLEVYYRHLPLYRAAHSEKD
jgi:hypothetical protein